MEKSKGFTMMTSFILGAALLFPMVSCGGSENSPSHSDSPFQSSTNVSSSTDSSEIDLEDYDLTTFELGKYTVPIWEGKISYAEGVFVKENAEGQTEPIPLLYPIDKIISVRSADLSVKYEEGKDYEVTEAGTLRILTGGKIPVLPYEQYYFETYTDDGLQTQIPASAPTGAYIVAETTKDNPGMSAWCLAVTYTHSENSSISIPESKSEHFPRLNEKLSRGENIKAVFYGDSITYGWGSTALAEVDRAPYCPKYCDLAMDYLEDKYGAEILRVNLSKSGETSEWGMQYTNYIKVCDENPDLVVLAFGMNDGVVTDATTFCANIKNIVKNIQKRCPEAEIVVVTSMLPNDKVGYQQNTCLRNYHESYVGALLEAEEKWESVGVADVTTIHRELLLRKSFQDTTSSNTNHPNDYMHRVYAQVLLKTLIGEDFYSL